MASFPTKEAIATLVTAVEPLSSFGLTAVENLPVPAAPLRVVIPVPGKLPLTLMLAADHGAVVALARTSGTGADSVLSSVLRAVAPLLLKVIAPDQTGGFPRVVAEGETWVAPNGGVETVAFHGTSPVMSLWLQIFMHSRG